MQDDCSFHCLLACTAECEAARLAIQQPTEHCLLINARTHGHHYTCAIPTISVQGPSCGIYCRQMKSCTAYNACVATHSPLLIHYHQNVSRTLLVNCSTTVWCTAVSLRQNHVTWFHANHAEHWVLQLPGIPSMPHPRALNCHSQPKGIQSHPLMCLWLPQTTALHCFPFETADHLQVDSAAALMRLVAS